MSTPKGDRHNVVERRIPRHHSLATDAADPFVPFKDQLSVDALAGSRSQALRPAPFGALRSVVRVPGVGHPHRLTYSMPRFVGKARSLHLLQCRHERVWVPAAGLAEAASVALMVELAYRLLDAAHEAGLDGRPAGLAEEAHLRILGIGSSGEELGSGFADLAFLADLAARRRPGHGLSLIVDGCRVHPDPRSEKVSDRFDRLACACPGYCFGDDPALRRRRPQQALCTTDAIVGSRSVGCD